MQPLTAPLTGVERYFDVDELIVSKTDLKGRITYANRVFQQIAGFSETELLGKPHSIIRHPDMPRCVFKVLWDTIQAGREIFAYVVNRARNGDHYWVFAHVTPSFDTRGAITGFHSNRRLPSRSAVDAVRPLYAQLVAIERAYESPTQAWQASLPKLLGELNRRGQTYDEFVFELARSGVTPTREKVAAK